MLIAVVGMNHETTPEALRERAAPARDEVTDLLRSLRRSPAVESCAVLCTCHRLEIYAVLRERLSGLELLTAVLADRCGVAVEVLRPQLYLRTRTHAARHLYRVAAGLDSIAIGEDQVLSQVKDCYADALSAGTGGAVLNELFTEAIRVGKRIRTETQLGRYPLSLSSLSVDVCAAELPSLAERALVVVGAGVMARLAVENARARGVRRITIVNRSSERMFALAEEVVAKFGPPRPHTARLEALAEVLLEADAVICATGSPESVLDLEMLHGPAQSRDAVPLVVVDLAMPHDVDREARELPGLALYAIDDLKEIAEQNRRARAEHLAQAEAMINEELPRFLAWLESRWVVPTVAALQQRGEQVLERELQRALNRLESGPDADSAERRRRVLREMGQGIVKQLVNRPISCLKRQSGEDLRGEARLYAEVAVELFGLASELESQLTPNAAAGAEPSSVEAVYGSPPHEGRPIEAEPEHEAGCG